MKDTLGEMGVKKFVNSTSKGFVGAEGMNGIKRLSGNGIKGYMYEVKIKGKGGAYRLLGDYDEKTGHYIWREFEKTHK